MSIYKGNTKIARLKKVIPTTLDEYKELLKNCYDNVIIHNSDVYTQNHVTLYTPSADCQQYIIRKRYDNGKYNAIWLKGKNEYKFITGASSRFIQSVTSSQLFQVCSELYFDSNIIPPNIEPHLYAREYSSAFTGYLSPAYDTLEEAINLIEET